MSISFRKSFRHLRGLSGESAHAMIEWYYNIDKTFIISLVAWQNAGAATNMTGEQ